MKLFVFIMAVLVIGTVCQAQGITTNTIVSRIDTRSEEIAVKLSEIDADILAKEQQVDTLQKKIATKKAKRMELLATINAGPEYKAAIRNEATTLTVIVEPAPK
jgi:archaellum component FlaG (FlaF/FlaG flagellin family)